MEALVLLQHVGLTCSTEDNADRFYQDLLGLNKSGPKTLSSDLSKAIFNLDAELQLINYIGDNIHFEIFIAKRLNTSPSQIEHLCLGVENISDFTEKCRRVDLEVSLISKGDKTLTFIKDYDGNLFEIKEL